jgi:hypothetical protein
MYLSPAYVLVLPDKYKFGALHDTDTESPLVVNYMSHTPNNFCDEPVICRQGTVEMAVTVDAGILTAIYSSHTSDPDMASTRAGGPQPERVNAPGFSPAKLQCVTRNILTGHLRKDAASGS